MNDKLERTWKEAVMTQLRYYPAFTWRNQEKQQKHQSGKTLSYQRYELGTSQIQVHQYTKPLSNTTVQHIHQSRDKLITTNHYVSKSILNKLLSSDTR
jgi:hypothetical protein